MRLVFLLGIMVTEHDILMLLRFESWVRILDKKISKYVNNIL
jgi:hypothetical protein